MATLCIPKETKSGEGRVALIPKDIATIHNAGHHIYIEEGAGMASGFSDTDYHVAGAKIASHETIWRGGTIVAKVKELQDHEFGLVQPNTVVFLFAHFRGNKPQECFFETAAKRNIIAIPYEDLHGIGEISLPLYEMSVCAGELAALIGCEYMRCDRGGPGLLPSDMKVQILGMGTVGTFAYRTLRNIGVQNFYTHDRLPSRGMFTNDLKTIAQFAVQADLVICAAVDPFFGSPKLITREVAWEMKKHALIIDVAIDEGGNCEFSQPTTSEHPIFSMPEGGPRVLALPNLPGIVPRSSSPSLSSAALPHILSALELKKTRRKIEIKTILGKTRKRNRYSHSLRKTPIPIV